MSRRHYMKALQPRSLRVWKLVRDEGGWWTREELCERLQLSPSELMPIAASLLRLGYCVRRDLPSGRAMGVTLACVAPAGETLEPALEPTL